MAIVSIEREVIENLRTELQELVKKKRSILDDEVIYLSQKLDRYIIEMQYKINK
jgi:hypothetical protein